MLSQFVSVYVPGTLGTAGTLSDEERTRYTRETASKLAAKFGGATAIPATGYYIADNGDLVPETVTIVKSFYSDNAGAFEFAVEVAAWLKSELKQELVSVETENGLSFV